MNKLRLAAALLLAPLYTQAHTFLVISDATTNQHVPVRVLMTEKLFEGERLLEPKDVSLRMVVGTSEQNIPLIADTQAKVLRGSVVAPTGTAVLAARAMPRYRAIEKGQQTDDPAKTVRIEAFAKSVINGSTDKRGFDQRIGDRLELVPQSNPADLDAGDELSVMVLFDGKPIAGRVVAMSPQQERVVAQADESGIARLQVPKAGYWVIRAGHHTNEADERSARYEASASLVIEMD